MKTLVDIDEAALKTAMSLSGAPTKKETVALALEELIRSRLRQQLKGKMGSGALTTTLSDLRKNRQRRERKHRSL